MTNTPFDPFSSHIDEPSALALLKDATSGADDGELFFERSRSESLLLDDGQIKSASYDSSEGFGLRSVYGETSAYAHSSVIDESALKNAVATAKVAKQGPAKDLAKGPSRTNRILYGDTNPIDEMPFATEIDLLAEIDAYARAKDTRVVQATANFSASFQEIVILRPEGQTFSDQRPLSRISVSVILEQDGRRESGGTGGGGRGSFVDITGADVWKPMIDEAIRIAAVNLDAEPAPAGVMDVVLGPGWPGILLHEAIGHGLEGDFNRKGSSAFAGLMGQRIAAPGVTVVDDGTLLDRRGSITIDDEGTPSQCTTLIEDGILVGYIQDRQNARLMGVTPTGNGRRQSYAHTPMPRMTNTYMLAGEADPSTLVAELKDGIYAVGFGGGQVDITNGKFVFSCTEAYRVKDGKVGRPVKGATLIGDGATALKQIRGVGNDMELDPGIGTCGKQGQWVPVGVGQPSMLIGGLTVGGAGT